MFPKLGQCKGQMKIQQMAFMLIAVTLFLVMAAMFILMVNFSSLRESAKLLEEKNALLLVSKIADSPEFACGNAFEKPRTNCIDMDKVMALKSRLKDYSGFWGIDGLEIRRIYPEGNEKECTSENYPDCSKFVLVPFENKNVTGVSNFVSLCQKEQVDVIYNKCEIGEVIVVYGD
jgi:hypothetical protein